MTATPFTLLLILTILTVFIGFPVAGILGMLGVPERRRPGGAVTDILLLVLAFSAWLGMQVVTVFTWTFWTDDGKLFLLLACGLLALVACAAVYRTPGAVTVTETLDQSLSRRNRHR